MANKKLTQGQLMAIKAQVERTQPAGNNDLVQGQEGNRRLNSGIMGDLFNVLSRPSAATATAASYALDKDPKTNILQGLVEGLSGKSDKHFATVLGEQGVTNPIAKGVGGFALDVALDPLTYLGIKGEKGISATRAESQAVQAADRAAVPRALFEDHVAQKAAEIRAADPSTLSLRFAGKQIGPKITGPSTVANKIKLALTGGDEFNRGAISRGLSREAELPGGIAETARVNEAKSMSGYEHHQKAIKTLFKDLTPEEKDLVTRHLEAGTYPTGQPFSTTAAQNNPSGFNDLSEVVDFSRKTLKAMFDDEVALGLRKAEDYNPNYVYKYFQNPERTLKGGFNAADSKLSLLEAEAKGLKPVTDADEMLRMKAASHYRMTGRAQSILDVAEGFGLKAENPTSLDAVKHMGWKPMDEDHLLNPMAKSELLKGYYLPEPVLKVLNQTEQILTNDSVGSDFMKKYDAVMRQWKFFNTTVSPGYYIRNSFGDAIQNLADGVWNPQRYVQSRRVLADVRAGHAQSLLNEVMGDTGLARTMPEGRFVKIGDHNIPTQDYYKYYLQSGAKSGQITTEVTRELDPLTRQGFGQYIDRTKQAAAGAGSQVLKAEGKAAEFNNLREDFWRMGHHIDAMDELVKKGMSLPDAAMEAGRRVRKYNIDYGQLSSFEQKTMRRVFPFYAWFRRNLPLQMQMLFTKPGFMAAYPKGQDLVQTLFNADDGEGDYMVPKWMRELAPVRLAEANNEGNFANKLARRLSGAGSNDAVFAPLLTGMTPIGDLGQITEPLQRGLETGSPVEALRSAVAIPANMATPAVRGTYELATGKQTFNGQDITDWPKWMLSQAGAGGRGAAMAVAGDVNESQATSSLTGLQVQPVTPARQKGEFRRREDVLRAQIDFAKTQRLQAMRRPVTPENKAKITSPKIKRLQDYLKWAGKSVGA